MKELKVGDRVRVIGNSSSSGAALLGLICTIQSIENANFKTGIGWVTLKEEVFLREDKRYGGVWLDDIEPYNTIKTVLPLP